MSMLGLTNYFAIVHLHIKLFRYDRAIIEKPRGRCNAKVIRQC